MTVSQIEALSPRDRVERSTAELAARDPELFVAGDEDVARLFERPAFARLGRAVVVDALGRPVGLISITDVERALRASRLAERAPRVAGVSRSRPRRAQVVDEPARSAR